jgi:predicted membrane-bound spermidine synthase
MNSPSREVPLFLGPVILLSGIASGISSYIWFRMFTVLFGIHQFSVTCILIVILVCMASGSRYGGKMADKISNQLVLFAVFQIMVGIFSLLNPVIFGWLQSVLSLILRNLNPPPFSTGIIRIVLTFLFLFIPFGSIGAFIPVLGRYFIRSSGHHRNQINLVISLCFTGIATGLILTAFVLIPKSGLTCALRVSAMISLLCSGIAFFHIIRQKNRAVSGHVMVETGRVRRNTMLFRKKKAVLEISARLTRAMLRIHNLQGFVVVSILIIACRMLNEYSTIRHSYLEILILSVYFAGMAIGSIFYKGFTARMANGYLMMASLEILGAFGLLFSFTLLSVTGPAMLRYAILSGSGWKTFAYHLVPVASLILFPAFINGLLFTLSGYIYPRRTQHAGRSIGRLVSLTLTGAISGLLISHYILLPLLGSLYSFLVLILIYLFSGFYLLFRDSRLIRGFRLSYSAITLACISAILLIMVKSGWINKGVGAGSESVRKTKEGSSAKVSLHVKKDKQLALYIDGVPSLETGKSGVSDQQLPVYLACIMGGHIRSSLVVGFGMGLTASALDDCGVPEIHITEIFPEVLNLSSDVFSDQNHDIITSSGVDVSLEDARMFLFRSATAFDLISSGYMDNRILPGYFTGEFYRSCLSRLTENGLLTQLIPLRGLDGQEFRSILRACIDVFPMVSLWYISGEKLLILAGKKWVYPGYCSVAGKFQELNQHDNLSGFGIDDAGSLLGRRIMDGQQLKNFVDNIPENSDDRPIVEFSRTSGSFRDTLLLRQIITRMVPADDLMTTTAQCSEDMKEILRKAEGMKEIMKQEMLSRMSR